MMKMLFFILMIFWSNYNIVCNQKLQIKWILDDNMPSNERPLELKYSSTSECNWYEIGDSNKLVNVKEEHSFSFKTSNKYCNLLIESFNASTFLELNYYTPIEATQPAKSESPIYMLAYLKSFSIIKESENEYKCQVIVTLPDLSEYSNVTDKALNENLIFTTYEIHNSKVKPSNQKSLLSRITSKIKKFFGLLKSTRKRESKNLVVKNVLDYTLSSDLTNVYSADSLFTCELALIEDNKTMFTKILQEQRRENKMEKFETDNAGLSLKFHKWLFIFNVFYSITKFDIK